jgi:CheY-like chemotaxis protein
MKKLECVLLIDDDDINNVISKKVLIKNQLTDKVIITKNGKEAIEFLKSCEIEGRIQSPELIILDHSMPIMDGQEFLTNIQSLNIINRNDIVILVLAIETRKDDIIKYKNLGVLEFYTKPLDNQIILELQNKYWTMQ